ncbi:hypothetical protein [Streptomyces cathayae]|uniref:DUF5666 domain-containing protein n=1 Tax=Streptomyces cathayae TaxID=3031124 RepID=A0ABY8KDL4_9ACTN|nr:hypothetical protein [Streptomyces sp. HUAS 5]WGD45115.1 hypothetical protein PYS65_00415 [Streptomyces sp. HUAS 5]
MNTRPTIVTVAVAIAAGLVVTGITYASASAYGPTQAAPASAPMGGDSGQGNEGRGNEGRADEGRGFGGRIHINERSYSAAPGDCITVVSGLGSRSLLGGALREYRHTA